MSDSLQQQLINAGLITQDRAEKLAKPKPKRPANTQRGNSAKSGDKKGANKPRDNAKRQPAGANAKRQPASANSKRQPPNAHAKKAAQKAKAAEIDAKAEAELAAKREVKAKIKKLIEENSTTEFVGELTFSYVVGERIRQLFVTKEFLDKISAGELAITRLNRHTHLVTPEVATQLTELNPQWLVVLNDPSQEQPVVTGEEDPYADYKVPDDLHW